MKLFDYNRRQERRASRELEHLSKVACTFKSDEWSTYYEDGPRTYGRLLLMETFRCVFIHVYGFDKFSKFDINGVSFDEDENEIRVHIFTYKPSYLIGSGGQSIELFQRVFTNVVKKTIKVNLHEVEPLYGKQFFCEI